MIKKIKVWFSSFLEGKMYVISWRQTYLLKEKAYFSKIKWSEEGGLGLEKWFLPSIFLTKQYMKILPGRRSAPNDIPNPFTGLKVGG